MARIRTIKPEFWASEQVMDCKPVTRLLFIGLWNFVDDFGRAPQRLGEQGLGSILPDAQDLHRR